MYEKNNSSLIITIIIMAIVIFAGSGYIVYSFARSKEQIREIKEKFNELQRIGVVAEKAAEQGLSADRELIERTRVFKHRNTREYKQISQAGEGLEKSIDKIIAESEVVEYTGLDNSGRKCYGVVGRIDMDSDKIKKMTGVQE